MGRPKLENKEDNKQDKSQKILGEILEDESGHFNYIQPKNYSTSTGSLNLDLETGGGVKPCIIRCSGESETGKSSFSLNLMRIFLLEKNRKRKGIYFLSDKELSEEIIKRCGVPFVEDLNDWIEGTCYIIRTNVYETVCNTIKKMIEERTVEFMFILDSMDNFAPKSALEVDFGESFQKGGTSAISSHFFRCFNILLPRLGHTTVLISQYRDTVNINKYNPIHKQTSSSGGRAIEHAVSWAFEFHPQLSSKEDMFWEGEPYKSKKVGHNCIIQFKKTTNEKTGVKVKYPIVYGRGPGKSIWVEREVYDQLLIWNKLKRKGPWLEWNEELLKELLELDNEIPKQIQGEDNLVKFLESKPKLTEYLYNKFKDILANN